MSDTALVTVIVPTHNHSETLRYSIQSICNQTISNLSVIIIGDGVTDELRRVAHQLCEEDSRVTFLDHEKTPRHGELLRDEVIRETSSQFIAYNCDDDLWFPHHLETLLNVIGDAHFVHPLPILIGADGVPFFMPSDLRRRDSVEWHLSEVPRNTISLSGVMHTRDAYLRLPYGWRETPVGRWTDHYMWQQFFEQEWLQGVTSPYATTLKLMAQGRDNLTSDERLEDIETWWQRLHSPDFANEWNTMVRRAMWKSAVDHMLVSTWREDENTVLRRHGEELEVHRKNLDLTVHELSGTVRNMSQTIELLQSDLNSKRKRIEILEARLEARRNELVALRESRSWRLTKPLRGVRKLFR